MTTMSRRPVRHTLLALSLAIASAAGVSLAAPAQAAVNPNAAPPVGAQYVALGDSYAAGYGIGTSTGLPVPGCAQSTQDYPHQVAAALHLKLIDRTCSGATTANIDQAREVTGDGTAGLQDSALSATTKLVTLTIGGNDLNFSGIVANCLAASPVGPLLLRPQYDNCHSFFAPRGGTDSLAATIANVVAPNVARVINDIKAKAPNARILFIDYPAISTTKAASPNPSTYGASCYSSPTTPNSFPFTASDTAYLQIIERRLNATLLLTTENARIRFVQAYPQSLTHSACAGTADPWLNGFTVDPATHAPAPGSLHPNLEGATQLADETLALLGPRPGQAG